MRRDEVYVFEDSTKTGYRKYAPKAFMYACELAASRGSRSIACAAPMQVGSSRDVFPLYDLSKPLGHSDTRTTEQHMRIWHRAQSSKMAASVLNKVREKK